MGNRIVNLIIISLLIGSICNIGAQNKSNKLEISSFYPQQLKKLSTDLLYKVAKSNSFIDHRSGNNNLLTIEIRRRIKEGLGHQKLIDQLLLKTNHPSYQCFLLSCLSNNYKFLNNDELSELIPTLESIIQDKTIHQENRLYALISQNDIMEKLQSEVEISDKIFNSHIVLLKSILIDKEENPELKRAAIKGVRFLNRKELSETLLNMITDPQLINNETLAPSLCLSLADFQEIDAIPFIEQIIINTLSESIYASAMMSLSLLSGAESLRILIENEYKFQGKYSASAIRNMSDYIEEILKSGNNESISNAVKATKYFYKGFNPNPKDQNKEFIDFKPPLKTLLYETEDKHLIKLILKQLQQRISKNEAKEIVEYIEVDAVYKKEWQFFDNYSKSVSLSTYSSLQPTKDSSKEIKYSGQEFGDAAYRNLKWYWIGFSWLGHGGLYAGITQNNSQRIIEVSGDIFGNKSNVVKEHYWSSMAGDSDYWGTYTVINEDLTFAQRQSIINTANLLHAYDIGYPRLALDLIHYKSNPGDFIEPHEIKDLRCDGLVEYCYEWNNVNVWGRKGINYDVCIKKNAKEHNNLYAIATDNPNRELAPIVQCGKAGGYSTYMTEKSIIDFPTYSINYTTDGQKIIVTIKSDDKSGIHCVKYKIGKSSEYISSPIQGQNPVSSFYTFQFSVVMKKSDWIYFYAIDKGGNFPEYASSAYINIDDMNNSLMNIDILKNMNEEIKKFSIYPNPFNPTTKIQYFLQSQSSVKISIYDSCGREVALLANEMQLPGSHSIFWDANNYSSGIYYIKILTDNRSETIKSILLK